MIRHGRTASNVGRLLDTGHPGAPLDETGLDQAAGLVARLAHEPIEAVYTSDLTRARQTGEPLAAARGLAVRELAGLREIFAGDNDMSPDSNPYVEMLDSWHTSLTNCLPNGEDAITFMARYDGAVAQIAAAGHACAALVSHGAALRVWVPARVTNLVPGAARWWALENTDVIVLDGDPVAGWRMVSWADRPVE
jgi:probable phosphoglycerate mutase